MGKKPARIRDNEQVSGHGRELVVSLELWQSERGEKRQVKLCKVNLLFVQ